MNRYQRLLFDGYMKSYTMRERVMMIVITIIMGVIMVSG